MKIRPLLVAAAVLGIAAAIFWPSDKDSEPFRPGKYFERARSISGKDIDLTSPATNQPPLPPVTAPSSATNSEQGTTPPSITPIPPGAETALPSTVSTELDTVRVIIRDYRLAYRQNPVGSNAEITKALAGANLKKINFLTPDAQRNALGELVDRWGTPYFFHQISGSEMEIRSAGPDKTMWTDDDQVIR